MAMYKIGEKFEKTINFTQEDVTLFSRLSGDKNPIHREEYNAQEKVLVQGMLAASRFGEVLGSIFPGAGTLNLSRECSFLRPIHVELDYRMIFRLEEVDIEHHVASFKMRIKNLEGKTCVMASTMVKNDRIFILENYPSEIKCMSRSRRNIQKVIMLPTPSLPLDFTLGDALGKRRSVRFFQLEELDDLQLSSLLWVANGVSEIKETETGDKLFKRTAPSASNHQEIDIYVFNRSGVFRYCAEEHSLELVMEGDNRIVIGKIPFYKKAPVVLCLVADYNKMIHHNDEARRLFYSSMDTGYVSQNIYLYCAGTGLATCACGLIDREGIAELLGLENGKVMLVHPVGIRKKHK